MILTTGQYQSHQCYILSPQSEIEAALISGNLMHDVFFISTLPSEPPFKKDSGNIAIIHNPALTAVITEFMRDRFSQQVVDAVAGKEGGSVAEFLESLKSAIKSIEELSLTEKPRASLPPKAIRNFFLYLMTIGSLGLEDCIRCGVLDLPDSTKIPLDSPLSRVSFSIADVCRQEDIHYLESIHKYGPDDKPDYLVDEAVKIIMPEINKITKQENKFEPIAEAFSYFFLKALPSILKDKDEKFTVDYKTVVIYAPRTDFN